MFERRSLAASSWLPQNTYSTLDEWEDLISEVRDLRARQNTVRYLIGIALLGDYLEDGLNEFGLSCADFERNHI